MVATDMCCLNKGYHLLPDCDYASECLEISGPSPYHVKNAQHTTQAYLLPLSHFPSLTYYRLGLFPAMVRPPMYFEMYFYVVNEIASSGRTGEWKCTRCTFAENHPIDKNCNQCSTPRHIKYPAIPELPVPQVTNPYSQREFTFTKVHSFVIANYIF